MSTTVQPPMNVRVVSGAYKSIDTSVNWTNIPPFALLTGENGSGKSQLLYCIEQAITSPTTFPCKLELSGLECESDQVLLLHALRLSSPGEMNAGNIQDELSSFVSVIANEGRRQGDPRAAAWARRLLARAERSAGRKLREDEAQLANYIDPTELAFGIPGQDRASNLPRHVARMSFEWFMRKANRVMNHPASTWNSDGPAPWEALTELLSAMGLPFEACAPEQDLLKKYHFRLRDTARNTTVDVSELSSGEASLVGFALVLFASERRGMLPRLVLLDEPDANLHPAMTPKLLAGITEVLVKKHGVRVIMTSHRPTTVVLVPPESIFEMRRASPRLAPSSGVYGSVALLGSNVVEVLAGVRLVFVEDEDDAKFYEMTIANLKRSGLEPGRRLLFKPASLGLKGPARVGGGKTVVRNLVRQLRSHETGRLIWGVVDHDSNGEQADGLTCADRYSIENYLWDPVTIYASLLGDIPERLKIAELDSLGPGDESKLRELPAHLVQLIVTRVAECVREALPNLTTDEEGLVEASFCAPSRTVMYPKWMLARPGKDLSLRYRERFGVEGTKIWEAYGRLGLTASDLLAALWRVAETPPSTT